MGDRLFGGEALRRIAGRVALDKLLAPPPGLAIGLAPLACFVTILPLGIGRCVPGIRSRTCRCFGLVAPEQLAQNPIHDLGLPGLRYIRTIPRVTLSHQGETNSRAGEGKSVD